MWGVVNLLRAIRQRMLIQEGPLLGRRRVIYFHTREAPQPLPEEDETGFVVVPSLYDRLFDAPAREDLEPTEIVVPVTGVVDSSE